MQAFALGQEFDRGWSADSRSQYTIGAAIAADEQTARTAFDLARLFDRGWSSDSRSRYMIAAAAALNPSNAHYAVGIPVPDDD